MSTRCLSAVLLFLSTQFLLSNVWCTPMCNNQCCRFVESFPGRLRRLREDYVQIRDFYVSTRHTETVCEDRIVQTNPPHALFTLTHVFIFTQEANDDLDTALLDQTVEDSFRVRSSVFFQVYRGCIDLRLVQTTITIVCFSIRRHLPATP